MNLADDSNGMVNRIKEYLAIRRALSLNEMFVLFC